MLVQGQRAHRAGMKRGTRATTSPAVRGARYLQSARRLSHHRPTRGRPRIAQIRIQLHTSLHTLNGQAITRSTKPLSEYRMRDRGINTLDTRSQHVGTTTHNSHKVATACKAARSTQIRSGPRPNTIAGTATGRVGCRRQTPSSGTRH